MIPINFPEQSYVLAKDQPEYIPLPVCVRLQDPEDSQSIKKYTSKYQLSDLEIEQIIRTKCIYFSQFGDCFHPILPQIDSPFLVCKISYKSLGNKMYLFRIPLSNGMIQTLTISIEKAIDEICALGELTAEQIVFIEMPSMGIDENGNVHNL